MTDLAIEQAMNQSASRDVAVDPMPSVESVPCVYCRKPIPAESFASWSTSRVLVSAPCPDCRRRVTLTEASIQHEFISTWWPAAGEDSAAFAHPGVDAQVDGTNLRIAGRDAVEPASGLGCLVDFGTRLGCWGQR